MRHLQTINDRNMATHQTIFRGLGYDWMREKWRKAPSSLTLSQTACGMRAWFEIIDNFSHILMIIYDHTI